MGYKKWQPVNVQADIDILMDVFGGFHDSCIKEVRLIGNGYVTDELAMGKKDAILRMIFQRQWDGPSVIELEFCGVCRFDYGTSDNYFPDIFDASLFIRDELIYWANHDGWTPDDIGKYPYSVCVSAKALRWRILENALGQVPYYLSSSGPEDERTDEEPPMRKGPGMPIGD